MKKSACKVKFLQGKAGRIALDKWIDNNLKKTLEKPEVLTLLADLDSKRKIEQEFIKKNQNFE